MVARYDRSSTSEVESKGLEKGMKAMRRSPVLEDPSLSSL